MLVRVNILALQLIQQKVALLSGVGDYAEGIAVEFEAIPNLGFKFLTWVDDDGAEVSNIAKFIYTMPANGTELYTDVKAITITHLPSGMQATQSITVVPTVLPNYTVTFCVVGGNGDLKAQK